jgi:hypothetical protein
MCNDFNKSLLISGDLHDMLENKEEFFSKEVGNLRLKGKRRKVDIYHIRPRKKYAKETSPYLRLLLDKLNIFKRRVVIEDRTKLTDSEFGHKQLKKIDDDQASEITKKAS